MNNTLIIQHFYHCSGVSWRKIFLGSLENESEQTIKDRFFCPNNVGTPEGLPEDKWIHPEIMKVVVSSDHVHMHVEYSPRMNVRSMVKQLKGRELRKL